MSGEELLNICQKHFPFENWEVFSDLAFEEPSDSEVKRALAELDGKGTIMIGLFREGAIAVLDWKNLRVRTSHNTGATPDEAMDQLKQGMREYVAEINELLGMNNEH
jgi:hypothetical protein